MKFSEGPIVAVSTSTSSKAALGIVRVSGFDNLDWLYKLTGKSQDKTINPRYAYFSSFQKEGGELIDEGIFTFFKGPKSFTGENLVEFSLHGNPLLLDQFVDYLHESFQFSRAKPGEFSFRALKNKKLNLTQVEGLDLILNANSAFGLKAGGQGLSNELYEDYLRLRSEFLEIRACIELLIDFAEDVGEEEIFQKMDRHLSVFKELIENLYKRSQGNLSHLLTPQVSLVGATNAGKSTLFNKLLNRERAIVSDIHGTTRDFISEYLYLDGHNFQIIDTAGLRETDEKIERVGIEQSLKINKDSFFKILVVNPFDEISFDPEGITFDAIVFTHSDLDGFEEAKYKFKSGPMGAILESGSIGAGVGNGPMGAIFESGPMGAKIESGPIGPTYSLEDYILMKYQELISKEPVPIKRHRYVISDIYDRFYEFSGTWYNTKDMAVISSLCSRVSVSIDELMGIVSSQEVLDHIFENFCIGK